jgi:hypothetical protein
MTLLSLIAEILPLAVAAVCSALVLHEERARPEPGSGLGQVVCGRRTVRGGAR